MWQDSGVRSKNKYPANKEKLNPILSYPCKKKESTIGALIIIIIILHTVLLAIKMQKFSIPGDTVTDDLIKCPRS